MKKSNDLGVKDGFEGLQIIEHGIPVPVGHPVKTLT
jgi:hypothetical protein